MHELSLVQALLDRVDREVAAHGAIAVHRVRLRVGELSGVEVPLLASAFEMISATTVCDGAELEVVSEAASWSCRECGDEVPPGAILRCPNCGGPARLTAGGEMLLERIEMEVA